MKKLNKAFTLAELLLCLGIIGVVSAMGMVIAKHGTDRAYNLFYYNGYINLYNAIADAKAVNANATNAQIMEHVKEILDNQEEAASVFKNTFTVSSTSLTPDFISFKAVNDLNKPPLTPNNPGEPYYPVGPTGEELPLYNGNVVVYPGNVQGNPEDGKEEGEDDDGIVDDGVEEELIEIITNNGTHYFYPNNLQDGLNGVAAAASVTNAIPITMSIPQRKTRTNNGFATVRFAYVDVDDGYLIPLTDGSDVNLQLRRDLLPAYIDDGKVGRNNVVNRAGFEYQAINYANFRDAFCTVRDGASLGTLVNCAGYSQVFPRDGVLKFADPRKAR